MFQGIDPDGLVGLAAAVAVAADRVRTETRPAAAILERNREVAAAAAIATTGNRTAAWGTDAGADLRWRADAIRDGQSAGFNIGSLLRAQFAVEAVFSMGALDESYRRWREDWQASNHRVDAAVADITRWLNQGLFDLDVTNQDLHNIRDKLSALAPSESDAVIAALLPAQLERWIAEMGHSINGFSHKEKQGVFAMLGARSSGEALARVHDAILAAGDVEDARDFGSAIQAHSPDRSIVDFVAAVVQGDLAAYRFSALAPVLAVAGIDHEHAINAVGHIISDASDALPFLIVDSGVCADETEQHSPLLATVSRTTDTATRAALLAAFTGILAVPATESASFVGSRMRDDHVTAGDDTAQLRFATAIRADLLAEATALIEKDPNGVIKEMVTTLDPSGSLTATYWGLLVADGQGSTIGSLLNRLRGGDLVQIDAFNAVGLDPDYRFPHARNLAFTAGTLNVALHQYAAAAGDDIDGIALAANLIIGLFGTAHGVVATLTGLAVDIGIDHMASDTKDSIEEQLQTLTDTVEASLRPQHDAAATVPVGDGASDAWVDVYLRIRP